MKLMKNAAILTVLLFVISILVTILLTVLTLEVVFTIIIVILTNGLFSSAIPPLVAALILKKIYIKVNKKIIPRKTKLIIVISYFLIQQLIGITLFLLGTDINFLITILLQLAITIIMYFLLCTGKKYAKKLN